ncbi:hypothetical protein ABMA28_004883 [Loxostege sticticalis]|uniref:MADF domain-containing protein n=1 Tax=Loxostege sticticalis TaxID=481309 RepID=A0ABD0SNH6_LOXSC
MTYNWETSAIFELIDLFRDRPVLWDVDREDHRDRSAKSAAWQEIAAHFGLDKYVVERKMKILISQYRRELQVRCQKGDASKWYAFNRLSFLKVPNTANGSASGTFSQNQPEYEEEESEDEESYSDNKSRIERFNANSPVSTPSQPITPRSVGTIAATLQTLPRLESVASTGTQQTPPRQESVAPTATRKRLRSPESDVVSRKKPRCSAYATNKMIKMLCKDRKSRDEFTVFGEYIANKLRNINNHGARNTVQHHISNILYNAEMGKYDVVTNTNKQTNEAVESSEQNEVQLATEASEGSSSTVEVQIKQEQQEELPPY